MKRCWSFKCCIATVTMMVLVHSAFGIGMWVHGKVNEAPWYAQNYRYMVVGKVKYTIMKEAVVQEVIQKKDAAYKTGVGIENIRRGDKVLIKAEGNRIYHIEILR